MLTALAAAAPRPWHGAPVGFGSPLLLFVPLIWLVVIVAVVAIVGRRWRRRAMAGGGGRGGFGSGGFGPHAWSSRSAESTLAERFAQGDIDEQEYRARLEVLRANRG